MGESKLGLLSQRGLHEGGLVGTGGKKKKRLDRFTLVGEGDGDIKEKPKRAAKICVLSLLALGS